MILDAAAKLGAEPASVSELNAQVALGEDSRRQFKPEIQSPDALAAEMAAFANSEGGVILMGVAHVGSLAVAARNDAPSVAHNL